MSAINSIRSSAAACHRVWTPLAEEGLAGWWDSRDVSDGAVSAWPSRGSHPQTLAQAIGAAQPNRANGFVTTDGSTDKMLSVSVPPAYVRYTAVPDAQGSTAGKGFSNNGLCVAPDGTWWLSNGGLSRENANNANRRQSLVHLSADFATKLHEIDLYTLADGPGAGAGAAPRGCAYDTSDDTLWCGWGTDKLIHVGDILTGGTILASPIIPCSSVSYSPLDDCLWVLNNTNSTIKKFRCSDMAELVSFASAEQYQDHLSYDPATDQLYLYCGDNNGQCKIVTKDPHNFRAMGDVILPTLMGAIEQGCVVGHKLYVNSNGYYHSPSGTPIPQVNRVLEYDLYPPGYSHPTIHAFACLKVPSIAGSSDFLFGSEQSTKWRGWGVFATSLTNLQLWMHTGADDTSIRCGGNFAVPNLSTLRIVYAEFKLGVGVTLWGDSNLLGTIADTVCQGHIRSQIMRLSHARDANLESRMDIKGFGVYHGGGDRLKTEGYLAHAHGAAANLPANHPYKAAPP